MSIENVKMVDRSESSRKMSSDREGEENDQSLFSDCGEVSIAGQICSDSVKSNVWIRDSGGWSLAAEKQEPTLKSSVNIRMKYGKLSVFKQPMCLIRNDGNETLALVEDVLHEISTIDNTVNVIAIAGPYRTGKSYLLNKLAGCKQGFPLGGTTEAKTKGLWVWCLEHPERPQEILMLIDTEGIGDVDKGDEDNDNNILCLATLLSSTFVYNMFGVITDHMLKSLSFVTKIAKKVVLSRTWFTENAQFSPDIGFFFPSFVLCLRDFTLGMNDKSPDHYFEKCLKMKNETDPKAKKYNALRLSVKQHFEHRSCFIFDRPATRRNDLARLEQLEERDLNKDFLNDTELFLKHIYDCKPKTLMDGSLINGRMFSHLVEEYTRAIKNGELPCIDDTLTHVSEKENRIAMHTAVEMFTEQIESLGLPLPGDFELKYKHIQKASLRKFRQIAVLDDKKLFEKQAEREMDSVKRRIEGKNKLFIQDTSLKILQNMYNIRIKPKVDNGEYFNEGGYNVYNGDFASLRRHLRQQLPEADSDLLHMCALDFEKRYRKLDKDILEKDNLSVSEINAKKSLIRKRKSWKEMSNRKDRQSKKALTEFKQELSDEREKEKNELKKKYAEMALYWKFKEGNLEKQIEDLKLQLDKDSLQTELESHQ